MGEWFYTHKGLFNLNIKGNMKTTFSSKNITDMKTVQNLMSLYNSKKSDVESYLSKTKEVFVKRKTDFKDIKETANVWVREKAKNLNPEEVKTKVKNSLDSISDARLSSVKNNAMIWAKNGSNKIRNKLGVK